MTLDSDLVAEALDGYEIGAEIGRGAMGIVLAGTHRQLGREVAIKQLPRAFGSDEDQRRRFVQEARVLAGMDHPHIVPIYDYVEHRGVYLLVMERLTGGSLSDRARAGLTPQEACAAIIAACSALQHAHERGTLHRDLKPENIMFTAAGVLKVTDFGIAKVIGSRTMATQHGFVIGTPAYMAPEQAQGQELSPATDIYALATVLYELLTGELPHPDTGDPVTVLYAHVHEVPTALCERNPDLPAELGAAVDRALSRNPEDRPGTARDLAIEIAEAAERAWGVDWVAQTGVPVVSTAPGVRHSRQDARADQPEAKPATLPAPAAPAAPATVAATPVAPAPVPPVAAPAPQAARSDGRSRIPRWAVGVAAALVVAVVALALAARGGSDDPETAAGADTSTSAEATTTTGAGSADGLPRAQLLAAVLPVSSDAPDGWSINDGGLVIANPDETLAGRGVGPQLAACTGAAEAAFAIHQLGPAYTSPDQAFGMISAAALDERAAAHLDVLREPKMIDCLSDLRGAGVRVSAGTPPAVPAGVAVAGWTIESREADGAPFYEETVVLQRGTVRVMLRSGSVGEPFPAAVRDGLVAAVAGRLLAVTTE